MLKNFNGRPSLATVLKASTVAGIAAAVLATGVPLEITRSYAEAVKVQAPAVPSFANVVDAVSPAVVSVRVENRVNPVSDNDGLSFDFNGRGFDDLPDDHPLKRFFKQFGGQDPNDQQGHQRRFGQNGPGGPNGPGGKGRLRPVAQGSGFFISEDGYIVTNNHVVSDGQAFVAVMNDGTELDAKLIGKDPRTDLRLRPDPRSTPLAIPVEAAMIYYEGRGQNWERAAFIKARAVAGDLAAGSDFLRGLSPFVFRKYLDYAAIADIHSIKRQIHAHKGHGAIAVKGHNVKLGRGGIREIEFFVQTQQLIAGGRMTGKAVSPGFQPVKIDTQPSSGHGCPPHVHHLFALSLV